MKFLIDANLSPRVSAALIAEEHEAIHVAEVDLQAASDPEIFDWAAEHDHVVVTADSDFGMLLAFSRASSPSVIQLRGVADLRVDVHIRLLVDNLESVLEVLESGAVVSLSPERIRVRELPIER